MMTNDDDDTFFGEQDGIHDNAILSTKRQIESRLKKDGYRKGKEDEEKILMQTGYLLYVYLEYFNSFSYILYTCKLGLMMGSKKV